jgi:hypothetical protein
VKKVNFISFMPEVSKNERIMAVWRAMNEYREKVGVFPEEVTIALDDGLPRLASNLCFSFGLHLSLVNTLASCLNSKRMQVDPHLPLEFQGILNTIVSLYEERYSPEIFVSQKYVDVVFTVNSLCSKCEVQPVSEDAGEVFLGRKTEVEKFAGVKLD